MGQELLGHSDVSAANSSSRDSAQTRAHGPMSSQASNAASDQVTSGRPASGAVILSNPMRRLPPAATINPAARTFWISIQTPYLTESRKLKTENLATTRRMR